MSLSIPNMSNVSAMATRTGVDLAAGAERSVAPKTDALQSNAMVAAGASSSFADRDFGIGNLIGGGGLENFPIVRPLPSPSAFGRVFDQLFQLIRSLIAIIGGLTTSRPAGSIPNGGNLAPEPAGINPPKPATVESKPAGQAPKPSIKVDGPDGFLFKPVSESDKKLAVLLPHKNTGNVASVVLKDADGKIVGRGKNKPAPADGREIFRFPKAGGSYPPNLTVEVTMKDGSTKQYKIGDPSKRYD